MKRYLLVNELAVCMSDTLKKKERMQRILEAADVWSGESEIKY